MGEFLLVVLVCNSNTWGFVLARFAFQEIIQLTYTGIDYSDADEKDMNYCLTRW